MKLPPRALAAASAAALTVGLALPGLLPATALAQAAAPPSADSGTMQRADPDMRRVLEALESLGPKPLETLTPEEARRQPSPADAVKAVLAADNRTPPMAGVTVREVTYPGPGGALPARVYTPEAGAGAAGGLLPVIVYYHGGGWVIADLDTYEATPMALAKQTGAIVVSAEYRHAPEHKFPAFHQDAVAAYVWAVENAASFGGDGTRVALAGESAGGNLAANVAIAARERQLRQPLHMLIVYPIAASDPTLPSYVENAQAKPLNAAGVAWFVRHALPESEKMNPMINLVAADLRGLPPATVIAADIDPLKSEGKLFADRLEAAGVPTTYRLYEGVTHEFFGMAAVVADAAAAQALAAAELKGALDGASAAR